MAQSQVGRDGQYRMVIDSKYKKLAKTRSDAKLLAILAGLYGLFKLGLASIPRAAYGEELDPWYLVSILVILSAFATFSLGSGGGKPHLERRWLLWLYVLLAAAVGTKAVVDLFNNPLLKATLMLRSPPVAQPYDLAVAKLLVQKLGLDPKSAVYDVDIINLALDAAGSFFLLAASAATTKFLWLKSPSGTPAKKTA